MKQAGAVIGAGFFILILINNYMQYLITSIFMEPFLTHWFDSENHFNKKLQMVVYDLINLKYTTDGKTWHNIKIDHL